MKPNNALKFARMDAGFTQEEMADLLGVSVVTIYRWEHGEYTPGPYLRHRLCKLLRLSEEELGFPVEEGQNDFRESASFLVDPCLPVTQMSSIIGQQSLLKEIMTSRHRIIGLAGLPGSGKSAITQAIVSMPDIRQQIEGILWASVGQAARPLRHLHRWLSLLDGERSVSENREEVQDRLRMLLRERKILIVLDDLWNAEDIAPYQLGGAQCRYLITTRLPVVANTVCDHIFSPRTLTESQAFHLLSHGLPIMLVREHREILRALCHQVGNLPLAVEQIGKYLRREARTYSLRRFQEALTSLFQPTSYLHLQFPPDPSSIATCIKRSTEWLSPSAQQAFITLIPLLPTAPATFAERQVIDLIRAHQQVQLRDFDQLVDVGLLNLAAKNRYQVHPVIAAYARLLLEQKQSGAEQPCSPLPDEREC